MNEDKWRVTVHPLAHNDMGTLRKNNRAAFDDMVAAVQTLQASPNVFCLDDKTLDTCHTYPDIDNCIRFKRKRGQWRVVLRLIVDGVQVRPSELSRPGQDSYLQIVFVSERHGQTYVNLRVRAVEVG